MDINIYNENYKNSLIENRKLGGNKDYLHEDQQQGYIKQKWNIEQTSDSQQDMLVSL